MARGEKARRFRRHLDDIGAESALKQTAAPGEARRLAAEAVEEGFEVVVAAGGDGTLNEVLNGLGDAPEGLERARLAVLPLGTVNVFAKELGMPSRLEQAWDAIRQGRELRIDLPSVEFAGANGQREQRYFAQLGGAGLDARAIELVEWPLKKRIGSLAYVVAGFRAALRQPSCITASGGGRSVTGQLVLLGNGRLYGHFTLFPKADLQDGLLEVCVFPRADVLTLLSCLPGLLLRGRPPAGATETFQAETLTLTSPAPVPLEIDGELIGRLPATFSIRRSALRVIVP